MNKIVVKIDFFCCLWLKRSFFSATVLDTGLVIKIV